MMSYHYRDALSSTREGVGTQDHLTQEEDIFSTDHLHPVWKECTILASLEVS